MQRNKARIELKCSNHTPRDRLATVVCSHKADCNGLEWDVNSRTLEFSSEHERSGCS